MDNRTLHERITICTSSKVSQVEETHIHRSMLYDAQPIYPGFNETREVACEAESLSRWIGMNALRRTDSQPDPHIQERLDSN